MINFTTLILNNPKISIITLSFIVTVLITIVSYYLTDRELMKNIKEKQKRLKEEMKLHRDNPQRMMEIQKQMMEDFPNQMKQSLKISFVTLIPLLLLFGWMRNIYEQTAIATSWIWYYIVFSIVFSIILRKVFKMD